MKNNNVKVCGWMKDERFLVNGNEKVFEKLTYENNNLNEKKEKRSKEVAKSVFPKIINMNQKNEMLPIISWFFASSMSSLIRKETNKQFPALNVYGKKRTGKSTTIKFLLKMIGDINGLQRIGNPFTILNSMSKSNAVPTAFDDYYPHRNDISTFHDYLINAYTQNFVKKRKFREETFELITPICFIGGPVRKMRIYNAKPIFLTIPPFLQR
ncbi:hypothetical protein [Bacillus badius]|uniref:hypothetical protein n=1 Tax=Bacillus badius TaxID=1455 RepID=UPI0007B339EE|nr:hypothetical protein [Bacillus badius]KZR59377.1 hypothetical protein A3781_13330 [Bacillus badius]